MKGFDPLYKAYFLSKKDKLYYNEIKEWSKLSDSSLTRVLKELVKQKILSVTKTKSNTFYKIKDKKMFTLKFSESALNQFNNLNIGVKVPLRNFLKETPKNIFTIVLFGSASVKEEQDGSDIDLLIVTDVKTNLEKQKNEANMTSNYPISLFQCSTKQFIDGKDAVIIQAKNTGFPIYKEQNFYEVLLHEYL